VAAGSLKITYLAKNVASIKFGWLGINIEKKQMKKKFLLWLISFFFKKLVYTQIRIVLEILNQVLLSIYFIKVKRFFY